MPNGASTNYTNTAISIEGTLLMLDDATPHVAIVVQAVIPPSDDGGEAEVVATTLSDEKGRYRFINLKTGQYQVRCYTLKGYVYYGEEDKNSETLLVECDKTLKDIDFRIAPFKKGTWRSYTYADGLAHNLIFAIHRDPNGMMWFGTPSGVCRYDGKSFFNFTTEDGLTDEHVRAIYQDPDGIMWFGTEDGGVSRYDGKEFLNLTTKDGLVNSFVHAIHRDPDGMMWFGTKKGVSRYDGKEFLNFTTEDGLADNWVAAIHHDSDGVMWFGTQRGVSRYDGKGFSSFTTQDGLADNFVRAIHRDPDGVIWFGTQSGVSRYDGKEFLNFITKDGLVNSDVFAIHQDPDGVMWFGTDGGASRYDGKGFVNFTRKDGLAGNQVFAINRDPDGVIWFGTGEQSGGGGVSRYDEKGFVNFTRKDGLASNQVFAIHRDPDGVIWFGTFGGGISRYDGKEFLNFTTKDGLASNNVRAIHRNSDGVMWFGTDGGASRYDGKGFINFTTKDGLSDNSICFIHRDPDGVMWFGTFGGGVARYDGKVFLNFTAKDGFTHDLIRAIHRDPDGVMWFGTWEGAFRYDGKGFLNFATKDGLPDNFVLAIHQDIDGVMWFGTEGGVSRYDGKQFFNFTIKDGLAGNFVHAIYRDPDGVLWLGAYGGGGVSLYDGVSWTSIDTRDGLAGNSVLSILQDSEGYLWFATDEGITRYRRNTSPPSVRIVSVTADKTYRNLDAIPALISGTRITIEYDSIDFKTIPEKRQYRCRIKEIDSDWRRPIKATSFDYTFDKPGAYTFMVQAIDRDLNYSEPAAMSLTIQPDPVLVSMQAELNHLRREVREKYHFENIIGRSAAIRQVRALMEKAIDSGLAVLITGETGTGKELVAKAIHHNSSRKNHPLLELNCGAAPRELISSILFGHRKGAFTGAHEDRIGLFEAASGGTLLLDEIGDMPHDAQTHLLRVLQERKIQRLGDHTSIDVNVRIIAMTNRDLMKEVAAGRFREDLYYRLSVFPIHIPSLRERHEDIPPLAKHLLEKACNEQKRRLDGFAPEVMDLLTGYSWPGNVRELENSIELAVALAEEGRQVQAYHFPPRITQGESLIQETLSKHIGLPTAVEQLQRHLIENALRDCDGNHTQAAKMLGLQRSNFIRLMRRLGIE